MIELQQRLLDDAIRNKAFAAALKKTIAPGKTTMADIGSGTGFLSFLAARFGAKKCYLYESPELLELSKKIARANRIKNCVFVGAHSTEVINPPNVDLVVSETLGNFAYEEHIIENLNDAHRFLKKGGAVMPVRLKNFVAPVTNAALYHEINPWDRVGFDIDFGEAKKKALQNMYVTKIGPEHLVGKDAAHIWDEIDFQKKNASIRRGAAHWNVEQKSTLYGFALWWECELAPGIWISTSPFEPRTHWDQIFLPCPEQVEMEKDAKVELKITSDSRWKTGMAVQWEIQIQHGKKSASLFMDTRKGMA